MLCVSCSPCLSVVLLFKELFLYILVSSNPFNLFLQNLLCHLNGATYPWQREKHRVFPNTVTLLHTSTSVVFRFIAFRNSNLLHLVCQFSSHHKEFERILTLALPAAFAWSEEMFYTCVLHQLSLLECLWSQSNNPWSLLRVIHNFAVLQLSASVLEVQPSVCQK